MISATLFLTLAALAADLAGTYTGEIVIQSSEGTRESTAMIVIKEEGGTVRVTAGPDAGEQIEATGVKTDGGKLTFEVKPPSGPSVIRFAVEVRDGRLTGGLTMQRGEETRTARLDLKKQ